jgi:hypothetical protein
VSATIGAPRQAPAGAQAVAPRRARRWSARLVPGDRAVWWAAGAVGLVGAVVLLVALLQPRELVLGSNSVAARADVVQVRPGVRMCVFRQRVPDGTGRIRFKIDSQTRAQPGYRVTVRPEGGPAISGRVGGSAGGFRAIDVPLERPLPDTARGFAFADICLTPGDTGGPVFVWGTNQLSNTDHPVRLGKHKDVPNRVALWYLPKTPQERSILAQLGTVFERASIFRPRFVGPWTFWLVLFGVFPLLCYAGVRLIARADEPRPRRVPLPVWVALIGFGVAITWSFVTPAFQSPDESEHFGAVQWFGETGKAVDAAPGKRIQWSTAEAVAIDATRELSTIERPETKQPWLESYELAYRQRAYNGGKPLPRDDGGGYHPVTSAHTPAYYAALSPAYLATRNHSVFTQLLAMRWTSAVMAGLTAMLAMLIVLELLPGRRGLAVAGGLLIAFQPMFSFIGGAVNNDNGVNLLAALTLYLAIRSLRRGITWPVGLALGAALAFTPLMKGTGYAIYPSIALALVGVLWRRHDRRALLGFAGFLVGFGLIYLGWDVLRESFDRTQFTTPGGSTPGVGFGARDHPQAYLVWLWQILVPVKLWFMQDFTVVKWPFYNIYVERGFGSYGWYAIQFPAWVYLTVALTMAATAVAGLRALWVERAGALRRGWEIAVLISLPVVVLCGVEAAYFTLVIPVDGTAEQGRYIFTAITALSALVIGATLAFGRRRALAVATGLVAGLMVLTAAGQWLSLASFYT